MDESDGMDRSLFLFRAWNFLPHIFSGFLEKVGNFSCRLELWQIGHLHNLCSLYNKVFGFQIFFGDVIKT